MLLALILSGCRAQVDKADDTAPTDTGPAETVPLQGQVTLPEDTAQAGALSAAAVLFTFDEGPLVGATLASAPLDGETFTLDLPADPPADEVSVLQADPLAEGAIYALVVFEDADADGRFTEGEIIRGLAMDRWLVGLVTSGDQPLGWSLVDLGLAGQYEPQRCLLDTSDILSWREGYPLFGALDEGVTVGLAGLPARLTLAGTVGEIEADHLVGLPYQVAAEVDLALAPFFDVPFDSGSFSVTLEDEPDPSYDVNDSADWRYAYAFNLAYADLDGDGWDLDDDTLWVPTCAGDQPVASRYNRPVVSWTGWRLLDCYGANVGWRAVVQDPETGWTSYLSSAEAAALTVDPSACRY